MDVIYINLWSDNNTHTHTHSHPTGRQMTIDFDVFLIDSMNNLQGYNEQHRMLEKKKLKDQVICYNQRGNTVCFSFVQSILGRSVT